MVLPPSPCGNSTKQLICPNPRFSFFAVWDLPSVSLLQSVLVVRLSALCVQFFCSGGVAQTESSLVNLELFLCVSTQPRARKRGHSFLRSSQVLRYQNVQVKIGEWSDKDTVQAGPKKALRSNACLLSREHL